MKEKGQSHNYPATTKGNPVETTPLSNNSRYTTIVTTVETGVGHKQAHQRGNRANQPLSNCFYGGAFPHCLVRFLKSGMVRVSGDFLPKLV